MTIIEALTELQAGRAKGIRRDWQVPFSLTAGADGTLRMVGDVEWHCSIDALLATDWQLCD